MRGSLLGLALGVVSLVTGCTYGHRHDDDDGYTEVDCRSSTVRTGSIDTDALVDVEPGDGVGVFIEYETGGRWHVYASCDTNVSRHDCVFDVVVHALGKNGILSATGDGIEDDDSVSLFGFDGVQMVSYTDYDFDGFFVQADPGAPLSVDVVLDDSCGSKWVYWIDQSGVHEGAPSTPFELTPSSP